MPTMLIDYYKAIEDSSQKMLEAAQSKNWDEVVRYEGACAVLIEQLRFSRKSASCCPSTAKKKPSSCSAFCATMPRFAVWPSLG